MSNGSERKVIFEPLRTTAEGTSSCCESRERDKNVNKYIRMMSALPNRLWLMIALSISAPFIILSGAEHTLQELFKLILSNGVPNGLLLSENITFTSSR